VEGIEIVLIYFYQVDKAEKEKAIQTIKGKDTGNRI
jgi:hypothetical protein